MIICKKQREVIMTDKEEIEKKYIAEKEELETIQNCLDIALYSLSQLAADNTTMPITMAHKALTDIERIISIDWGYINRKFKEE